MHGFEWIAAALAFAAFSFGDGSSKAEERDRFDALKSSLRDRYPDKRRAAVAGLAELGTGQAWELVVGALEDHEPEVADEAQVRLALIDDKETLEKLFRKQGLLARNQWVRWRVAEAFGRSRSALDGERLCAAFDQDDPEGTRLLLWSIERLASSDRLSGSADRVRKEVEQVLKGHREPMARAAALLALEALESERIIELVREACGDRSPQVRSAALLIAPRLDASEAFVPLAAQRLADDSSFVRIAAIECLRELGTREALLHLIERIELEQRLHLRWTLVRTLQVMTGMKHRLDPRPWRSYASQLPGDWRAIPGEPAPEQSAVVPGATAASFAGLPIRSDRICFLIDFSGSLWQKREEGRTRKQLVDEKLAAMLPALADGTEFNLVPYTGAPLPWQERLVKTSSVTVKQALAFFSSCHATGRGNFYDAALLAMADERVDTICVLTDGAPTGGHHWNLELMVALLLERNRFRRVAFDSILVDASPGLQKHWQELARKSGGRSIVVSF